MRTLQVMDAVGKRLSLTIRKDQVTLKIPVSMSLETRQTVMEFVNKFALNIPELPEVIRGKVHFIHEKDPRYPVKIIEYSGVSESGNTVHHIEY